MASMKFEIVKTDWHGPDACTLTLAAGVKIDLEQMTPALVQADYRQELDVYFSMNFYRVNLHELVAENGGEPYRV